MAGQPSTPCPRVRRFKVGCPKIPDLTCLTSFLEGSMCGIVREGVKPYPSNPSWHKVSVVGHNFFISSYFGISESL